MKKIISVVLITFSLAITSCSVTSFHHTKPGLLSDISLAKCEAIEYPHKCRVSNSSSFVVNVMVANLYYGKKNDGSYGLLVGTEEKPGYCYESITIALKDYKKEVVKQYDVDAIEYAKQENGIDNDKLIVKKTDFRLVYSFDLIELFVSNYNNTIYFEVGYLEKTETQTHFFGPFFSFSLAKNESIIELADYNLDYMPQTFSEI